MAKHSINIDTDTFDKIMNAMQRAGIQLNPNDDSLIIHKDIALKPPVNYTQLNIRKDIADIAAKVYKAPIQHEFEVSNSKHFIEFVDSLYKYCLEGTIPTKENVIEPGTVNKSNSAIAIDKEITKDPTPKPETKWQ